MQGFVLRLPPQNKAHATFMQPLRCVSQHPVANLHISRQHQMTTIMQPFQCDLQPQIQETHRTTHTGATTCCRTQIASGTTAAAPAARGTFHRRLQPLYTENTRFRAPASSPKQSPCNIHAAITMRFAASRRKPAHTYAHSQQSRQQSCGHSNAICNHRFKKRIELRTHEQPLVAEHTGGTKTTPTAPAAHRRYLSSPAAATLHWRMQGFVLRLPLQNIAFATFMQPLQSHHFPKSPVPFVTNFPLSRLPIVTTSLPHYFPSSPLPNVTTPPSSPLPKVTTLSLSPSLRHHFPSHTALHQCQFFCDVLLCDVKSHAALHQCQFFCDVLLCDVKLHTTLHQCQLFCDVSLCDVKSHTTLHQCQFCHFFQCQFFWDVLLCDVKSHTTLHQCQVSQFYLSVTRKHCFPTLMILLVNIYDIILYYWNWLSRV